MNLVVCDLGTGTGLWLTDLAKSQPSAALHGFDIDTSQAPPKEWLPSNVSIETLDVFQPVPERLLGMFDVVYVRLFMCVVKDNDPQPILLKIMQLLKPGGYLQWMELDLAHRSIHKRSDVLSTTKFEEMNALQDSYSATRDKRIRPTWVTALNESFAATGLEVLADDLNGYSHAGMPIFTDTAFMTWYEFGARMEGRTGDEFRRNLQEAQDEYVQSRRGIAVTENNRVVVGRKSL
ncbi:MAG: hypothetical protein Q9222_001942 [Ikaeria aurantiellina]